MQIIRDQQELDRTFPSGGVVVLYNGRVATIESAILRVTPREGGRFSSYGNDLNVYFTDEAGRTQQDTISPFAVRTVIKTASKIYTNPSFSPEPPI